MQTTLMSIVRGIALAGLCMLTVACGAATNSAPTAVPATAAPAVAAPTLAPAPTAVAVTPQSTIAPTAQAAPTTPPVPTAQAAATAPAAPTAPAATAAETSLPTAAAQPTSGAARTTTPQSQSTASAQAVGQNGADISDADAVHLVVDPSASTASFHAQEQLVGNNLLFTPAVGTTPGVTGTLVIGGDGSIDADQSLITVDLSMLKSDESRRDNFIKSNTLETDTYPTATFVPREAQGLPMPLPTSGQATFQLLGDLTVHGVTQPATWHVTAQFADNSVTGTATTGVKLTDFGMSPPKVGPVLSVQDDLTLDLAFTANRGG